MPTTTETPNTRRIRDLKLPFFLRMHLDANRLDYFRQMRASGISFPPITVNQENVVLDGRHRLSVASERGDAMIPVEVVQTKDQPDAILVGLQANCGGAQPMTMRDLVHTADLLSAAGVVQKDLIAHLVNVGFPERFVSTILDQLRKTRRHQRVYAAMRALKAHPEKTLNQIAEEFGVTPADIKKRLEIMEGKGAAPKRAGEITALMHNTSSKFGMLMDKLLEGFPEGLIAPEVIDQTLDAYDAGLRSATASYRGWVKRWAALRATAKRRGVA